MNWNRNKCITLILLGLLSGGCSSCAATTNHSSDDPAAKSELVQSLEAIFYAPGFAKIPQKIFNAEAYGVKADGSTINTKAIQATIDAAHEAGGGVVILPQGTTVSGALFVKSNVELRLDEGVVLQAVQDDAAYPDKWTRMAGIEIDWPAALINVYEQENVRITGKGIIDGNGKYWWDKFWGDPARKGGMFPDYVKRGLRWALDYDCKRVRPIVVYKSKDVLLKGFTVQRAGFWTITFTFSDRMHADGITIRNNIGGHGPSTDGINTDSSRNVLIENCDVDCNDDNFCLKSGRDSDGLRVNLHTENVVIRNCKTGRGYGLITLGSETSGGINNVEVYNMKGKGTANGFYIKSAKIRGGVIRNIWIHDVELDRVRHPFHWDLNWYPAYSYPPRPKDIPESEWPAHWHVLLTKVEPAERGIPEFHNLRISNVKVTNAGTAFIANAYVEKPMRNITFENVTIEAKSAGRLTNCKDWTMKDVTLKVSDGKPFKTRNCVNVELPSIPEGPLDPVKQTALPGGGISIESEDMEGPWKHQSDKYKGFQGSAYSSSPYSLGDSTPTPLQGLVQVETAGKYTLSVRALKGGSHQDRALAVEVNGKRLNTTHQGNGPAEGEYSWEEAGVVDLPAGNVNLKIHPVGKRHPTADAIKLIPVSE
jgi:polygalacturonase